MSNTIEQIVEALVLAEVQKKEIAVLRYLLIEYGRHKDNCAYLVDPLGHYFNCNCGFDKVEEALKTIQE